MTVLGTDNFTRANQTTWGTASDGQTWARVRGAMNWAITSNEGTCNSASAFNIFRLGSLAPGDVELLVRVTPADTPSNTGLVARFVDSNNFYYGVLNSGFLTIGKDVAGSFSTLRSVSFTYSAGTAYWLRFRLIGTNLFLKAWQDGVAGGEPNTWQATITDSSLASGGFGCATDSSSATNTQYDSFYTVDYANVENLSASDSFLSGGSYVPLDSLSAVEILLGTKQAMWADLLALADSVTFVVSPPATARPGIATLSDGLHGAAAIQGLQVDQATASDVVAGSVAISDQG